MIRARFDLDLGGINAARAALSPLATRMALNKAAAPVKAAVVRHAEAIARYGFLARSIRIKVKVYDGRGNATARSKAGTGVTIIGPSASFSRVIRGRKTRGPLKGQPRGKARPAKYGHLVERGTVRSRPRPFLAPALAGTAWRFIAGVRESHAGSIRDALRRKLPRHLQPYTRTG